MKKFLSLLMLLTVAIPSLMATDFKLVTSSQELEVGANYIIAAHYVNTSKGFNKLYVMNDAATSLNSTVSFTGIEVSNSNDQIISMPDGAAVFSLISNGDNFRLQYNGATVQGFLSAYWDSTSSKSPKNGVRIRTEETDYESIIIDPASNGSQIKSIASGYTDATNFMLYVGYSGSSITSHNFKFYTTSIAGWNYAIAKLYKEVEPTDVASIAEYKALKAGTPVRFTCPLTITKAILGNIFVKDANGDFGCIYTQTTKDTDYTDGYVIPAGVTGLKGEDNRINAKNNLGSIGTPEEGSAVTPKDVAYTALKNDENLYGYVKVAAVPVVYDSSNSNYYAYSTDTSAEGMLLSVDGSGVEITDGKTYTLTGIVDTYSGSAFLRVFAAEEVVVAFAEPTISLEAGTFDEVKEVTITTTDGDYILYTTNDDDVLANFDGTLVKSKTATVTIDKSCTLRAIATNEEMSVGAEASATYTLKTATPEITMGDDKKVSITTGYSDGVTIYYTTDGTPATTESAVYDAPFSILRGSIVNAVAKYKEFDLSDAATFNYSQERSVTFGMEDYGVNDETEIKDMDMPFTKGDVTIVYGGSGTTTKYYKGAIRLYSSNNITVSSENGIIASVTFSGVQSGNAFGDVEVTAGEFSNNVWSNINAKTATLTNKKTSQVRFTTITVNYILPEAAASITGINEVGTYYTVKFELNGQVANGGVLYARTTDTSVEASKPNKDFFDKSYEDYDWDKKYDQRDWVAINGNTGLVDKKLATGFIARYDGVKLTPVAAIADNGNAASYTLNTFGVANVFYGNYKNTDKVMGDYKPFFVKAKVNEVAYYVGEVKAATDGGLELWGSGVCGKLNDKGLKIEANGIDITASAEYQQIEGVLVADAAANGGVKLVALSAPTTPTGVAALKAEGKATVYGTEGAVVVNGADGKVMIFDAMGRMVKSVNAEGAATVAMPAGYYIVRTAGTAAKVMVK